MPDGIQQLGTQLAEALAPRRSDLVTVSYGTVKAVNETEADVRLDVDLHGGTLYGLPMTTACKGVAVGDRVIVQTYGHLSTVTGVIAHDNSHYVTGDLDLRACSAYNSGFPPRYAVAGGVLMLSGRITSPYINAEICDLSGLVHPSAIPPSNVNRSIPCLMNTSAANNGICNVFLNSAGILFSAQSNYIFVDLSAVVLPAK